MVRFSIIQKIAKYSKYIIQLLEHSKINYYGEMDPYAQPVFIIGAPRTGSTILYQLITNKLSVLYPDNLVNLFRRNFYFGFLLSQKYFQNQPHNCFASDYGNTAKFGLHAPSECGGFWYRWLPTNKHYIKKGELNSNSIDQIKNNIFSVINRFNGTLVIKNLSLGQRMALISEIAPNAKFLIIKRDPLFVAQSLYIGRQRKGIKNNEIWSIVPLDGHSLRKLNIHEHIVKQIFYLEKQIFQDKVLFPEKNILELTYERFFADYDKIIKGIQKFIGPNVLKREQALSPKIKFGNKPILDNYELDRFREEIDKLDWVNYEIK